MDNQKYSKHYRHKKKNRDGRSNTTTKSKRKKQVKPKLPTSLEEKVKQNGGKSGYVLEETNPTVDSENENERREQYLLQAARQKRNRIFKHYEDDNFSFSSNVSNKDGAPTSSSFTAKSENTTPRYNNPYAISARKQLKRTNARERFRQTPATQRTHNSYSIYTPSSSTSKSTGGSSTKGKMIHIVASVSENLARETCISSLDAGSPTTIQITKQANSQTYAETLAYLDLLKPHEILLNEGRRNSQLATKILALYGVDYNIENPMENERGRRRKAQLDGRSTKKQRNFTSSTRMKRKDRSQDEHNDTNDDDDTATIQTGPAPPTNNTIVKFIPRTYFDQTKGAELLQRIARPDTYDSTVVGEYILLSSSHAILQYAQLCLGATYTRHSLELVIHSGGKNRLMIDRSTLLHLELLANAKTGKLASSLVGTIDCTKTSVGSRLLRTNLMAPPTSIDTINARLDLVDVFLQDEEFFYVVMDQLQNLPDVDKMLSHMALVPNKKSVGGGGGGGLFGNMEKRQVTARMASRGIAALVCIKSTLVAIPEFRRALEIQLNYMEKGKKKKRKKKGKEKKKRRHGDGYDDDADSTTYDDDSNGKDTESSSSSSGDEEDDSETEYTESTEGEETSWTDGSSLLLGLGGASSRKIRYENTDSHASSSSTTTPSSTVLLSSFKNKNKHQLLRAILYTMKQPALNEILTAVTEIFTESTTYSRNAHAMRHQECFALRPNTDGMMDVLRKAFLANVDDIYRLADEYAEKHDMTIMVKETTARGYYLSVSADVADDLPVSFIQPVKSGRFIHCTTEEYLIILYTCALLWPDTQSKRKSTRKCARLTYHDTCTNSGSH
mmetsp:Transcript_13037/g.19285  ORF Transcript_13037/g.19285 Transcript_13037/m.19285 type:complete len:842 (+) Transcript_13037:164-2689(+)